jgi:hypothetical protein
MTPVPYPVTSKPGGLKAVSEHRWRFDQPVCYTAKKMFRNAFADGYEAITAKKYYRPKALTTKEEVIDETEAGKERLIKTLQRKAATSAWRARPIQSQS